MKPEKKRKENIGNKGFFSLEKILTKYNYTKSIRCDSPPLSTKHGIRFCGECKRTARRISYGVNRANNVFPIKVHVLYIIWLYIILHMDET